MHLTCKFEKLHIYPQFCNHRIIHFYFYNDVSVLRKLYCIIKGVLKQKKKTKKVEKHWLRLNIFLKSKLCNFYPLAIKYYARKQIFPTHELKNLWKSGVGLIGIVCIFNIFQESWKAFMTRFPCLSISSRSSFRKYSFNDLKLSTRVCIQDVT